MSAAHDPYNAAAAEALLLYIRAGAYEDVAAEAAGVPRAVYRHWLARGEGQEAEEPYRTFARRVQAAKAQTRVWAEIQMREKEVRNWLKCGPGKEAPGNPGWSKEAAPATPADGRGDPLDSPEIDRVWAILDVALIPYPEMRLVVARALHRFPS
jgi:hypothetical protein